MTSRTPTDDRAERTAPFFDPARLTLARQLAGLRKSELAAAVERSPTAVASWESGAKRPAPTTLARLSLALGVEPGFFAVHGTDVVPAADRPHFRSLRGTGQLVRDQASAYARLAVEVAWELERHVELPPVDLPCLPVAVDDPGEGPERAARAVRAAWGLGTGPAGHLVRLLEAHGVLVVFSPPGTATVDAYSAGGGHRPVVVLNPVKNDYYRQRFDVAHELGHLVMHGDAEPGGRVVEDQAHRFAAELLAPAAAVRDALPTAMGGDAWRELARLKERWGISLQALLYRARRLGRLGEVSYRNAMAAVTERGWRRCEPGLVAACERPSLLPRAVELLAAEGIDEAALLAQCRVPAALLRTVTGREPVAAGGGEGGGVAGDARRPASLLGGGAG